MMKINNENAEPQDALDRFVHHTDFVERFLLEGKDPRAITAKRFFDEVASGVIKLYKTTRAGATVALCSESIRRNERTVMVCRTNRNITKTIKEDVVSVLGKPVKVIHIMRNSFCPKIMDLIYKYPAIEKIGVIPLPNCDHCDLSPCPIREAFETPTEKVQVYALTYAKLASLMMSNSEKVKELVGRLLSAKNIIFDEVQFLEEGDAVAVNAWEKRAGFEHKLNIDKYDKLAEPSPLMQKFLDKARELIHSIEPPIEELKLKSLKDHYTKHLAVSVKTPAYMRALQWQEKYDKETERKREELQRLYPDKSWLEIAGMMGDYGDVIKEIMKERETLLFSDIIAIQEILIKAIIEPSKHGLTEEEIVALSKLLFIINADTLAVSYVRSLEGEQISIQSENSIMYTTLRSFISRLLYNSMDKRRIVFTTATFGTLRIERLLNLPNVIDYVWGDPLNTNARFLVAADKSRVSPYNFGKKSDSISACIKAVAERFGPENVQVCTMNKAWSRRIGLESTWYASDLTEGVSSKKRIWIFVGLAEKPVNAKDHLAITQAPFHDNPSNLQEEEFLYYLSQKLRADSVHIASYQAFSRAKDPEGRTRSIAIVIGARKEDVERCLLWGPTRNLKPIKSGKTLRFDVEIENSIGKPHLTVAPLTTDIEESLHIIDQWITYGKIVDYRLNWIHLKKLVDARGYISAKRLTKTYGLDEQEVAQFLTQLPDFFTNQGITDYILVYDSRGAIKAIAQKLYYEKQTKPSINIYNRFRQTSIVQTSWFIALKGAVDRAPDDLSELSPGHFNRHVSGSIYGFLGEFFDALQSDPSLCSGWIVIGKKGGQRETRSLIRDFYCLGSWVPDFPRRFGVPEQVWVNDYADLTRSINNTLHSARDAFISVYAFPGQQHPKEGGNPPVSTIFIDLDLESPEFSELRSRWEHGDETIVDKLLALRKTLMTDVLRQAKALVGYLKMQNIQPRILLSGFKGIHLFLDLPCVQFSSLEVAKYTIKGFLDEARNKVAKETGVEVAFDTSVIGDLSRICRIPNTVHNRATKLLGRPQYAVPVTIEELMSLTPEGYDELCSSPRYISVTRSESHEVLVLLTKIAEDMDLDEVGVTPKGSVKDAERLETYEHECTREVLTDEDFKDLKIRPCFKRVRRDRISLDGSGGHLMRIGAVMELATQELSIPSIVRWFDFCADYDPAKTEAAVKSLISRGYTDKHLDEYGCEHRNGLKCTTIQRCKFCLGNECETFKRRH